MRCNGPILQKDINLFPTYCTTHSKIVQKLILYEITDYKRKNIFSKIFGFCELRVRRAVHSLRKFHPHRNIQALLKIIESERR